MTPSGSALGSIFRPKYEREKRDTSKWPHVLTQHGQRCGHQNGTGLCDSLIHKYESFLGEKWMWLNSFGSVRQETANRKHLIYDYMDRVIKTHRTLHIFLPHNTDKSSALLGGVGVKGLLLELVSLIIVFPKTHSFVILLLLFYVQILLSCVSFVSRICWFSQVAVRLNSQGCRNFCKTVQSRKIT